jgi:hypothetical protein
MKNVLIAALLMTGCGVYKDRIKPKDGKPGTSCTTRQDSVGVFVECTDGTDSFIPFPKDGETGATGPQGETVVGQTGEAGSDGLPGAPGQSCLLEERNVTCVNGTKKYKSFLVCPNGELFLKDVKVNSGC